MSLTGFRRYTCLQRDPLEPTGCRLTFLAADEEEQVTLTDDGCFVVSIF